MKPRPDPNVCLCTKHCVGMCEYALLGLCDCLCEMPAYSFALIFNITFNSQSFTDALAGQRKGGESHEECRQVWCIRPRTIWQNKAQACCVLWWLIPKHTGFQDLSVNSLVAGTWEWAWKTMCAHVSSPSKHLTPYYEIRTCLRQGQGSSAHFSQRRGANTDLRVRVKAKTKFHFSYCHCSL